jgi:type IV pilus assembly protein PilN
LVFVDGELPFIYDIFMSEEDAKLIRQGQFENLDYVFTRLSDQIRAAIQSFIAQSGRTNIELIEFASSLSNAQVILAKIKEVMPDYKIDFLNPLANINVPENLKSRVDADKNSSSRSVSIGLASRRLDIFGYFKFVTAVSNINLLPNRDEKIQEQKRKAVVSESAKKVGVILGAVGCFVLVLSLLFGFAFSYADKVDLARNQHQQEEEKKNQLETQYNNLQSFINQRAARNERMFNLRFLNGLPRSVLVKELRLNYDSPSVLILVSRDPTQFTVAATYLSRHPDVSAAKLESVEIDGTNAKRDQQLGKIVMVLE